MRVAIALVVVAGCSLVGVHGPRASGAGESPGCTDSEALPVLDTVPAVVGLGLGGVMTAVKCEDAPCGLKFGLPFLVVGALFAVSAAYGYHAVWHCHVLERGSGSGSADGSTVASPPSFLPRGSP